MASKKTPQIPEEFAGNHRQTSELLGITERALWKAVKERGCPVARSGVAGASNVYDWRAVLQWRVGDLQRDAFNLDGERARLAKLQADRLQVDLRARSGDLLQRDRLEQAWSMSLAACRDSLLGIPRRLANELVGEQDDRVIARRIDEEIRHAFKAMVLEFSKPAHSDGAQSAEPPAGNA